MLKITDLRLDFGDWGEHPRNQLTASSTPFFGWMAVSDRRNDGQAAWHALVHDGERLLWDSGWVETEEQGCRYAGEPLPADCPLRFTVEMRNRSGERAKAVSRRFYYVCCDFPHTWIADPKIERQANPAPVSCFEKELEVSKPVEWATAYVCGIGYHQLTVNGALPDASCLDPAVSDYTKRCYMAVYPQLGEQLTVGKNRLRVRVAGGWRRPEDAYYFACYDREKDAFAYFFGPAALTATCHIRYTDGEEEWIHTDESWSCYADPCVRAQIFGGETYDARIKGTALFSWPAATVAGPGGELSPMTLPPISAHEVYKPVSVSCLRPGCFVVDFGQNISGVCRLKLPAMKAGQRVVMTHTEELDETGDLSFSTMRKAASRDEYIAAGDEAELSEWQPAFTYHGFRYVRIEGLDYVGADEVAALCLRTAVPEIGRFSCGSAVLNAIHNAVMHTERDNMMGLLTDCPQRDERMGWMNDATVRFEETAYNFDIARIFQKVLRDVQDTQSAEDGSITCTAPFIFGFRPADPVCSSYILLGELSDRFVGNRPLLEAAYDGFCRWENCLSALARDGILREGHWGDWAGPVYACVGGETDIDATESLYTPREFMSTGYYYWNACRLAEMSARLGYMDKQRYYEQLAEMIRTAILREWWQEETATMATGSQGCQSFALWLGLIPPAYCQAAADRIHADLVERDYRITTGNLCTRYLLDALSQYGYADDAYRLLTAETYPSIGFMLQQEATTVWERWELKKEPGMNSHNHPMYGAVDHWMYAWAAGIRPLGWGFERVQIRPVYPRGLQSVCAAVKTVKGELTVRWIRRFGHTELRVNVPFGCCAEIFVGDSVETVGSGFWSYTFA